MKLRTRGLTLCAALTLSACESVPSLFTKKEGDVVYALGSREAFTSPLERPLKPAGSALEFDDTSFLLTGAHSRVLDLLAEAWKEARPRYLIAGYTPPTVPEDYARAVSERRAQAIRQHLIEHGVEASHLQTVGFGQDAAPAGPSSHVVVIYQQP